MHRNDSVLKEKITSSNSELKKLLGSLPDNVRPNRSIGSTVVQLGEDRKPIPMVGWDYDWDDSGSNPPPWSDIPPG